MSSQDLSFDRLADRVGEGAALQVLWMHDTAIGSGAEPTREPHRHDYHELLWVRCGSGVQRIDGEPVDVRPGAVTLIGRGQVHTFERGEGITGAVVRFKDELLTGGMGWLLAGRGGRVVPVPEGDRPRLEGAIEALGTEARRPADERTPQLQHHLLSIVLLWVERWYDAVRIEHREPDDAQVELHRRFARLLEDDYARHHDAGHYADALAVPPAALSRALSEAAGRSTKELILDRVMLEAARLLRYTDRAVGEVAHATGFTDPLYFSRAFKRRFGESPMAYRDHVRGRTAPP